jgi:acetolactate synthase regulatory subunit
MNVPRIYMREYYRWTNCTRAISADIPRKLFCIAIECSQRMYSLCKVLISNNNKKLSIAHTIKQLSREMRSRVASVFRRTVDTLREQMPKAVDVGCHHLCRLRNCYECSTLPVLHTSVNQFTCGEQLDVRGRFKGVYRRQT